MLQSYRNFLAMLQSRGRRRCFLFTKGTGEGVYPSAIIRRRVRPRIYAPRFLNWFKIGLYPIAKKFKSVDNEHMEVVASEFARMAGVSPMAISKKIAKGTLIRNSGGKLDTDNPVNRAYIERKREIARERNAAAQITASVASSTAVAPARQVSRKNPAADGTQGAAGVALNMTLRQLVTNHGSIENVERYAKLLRDLTAADDREQRIQMRRLELIQKDFVVSRLFAYQEQLMNKLLDVPEGIADQVVAIALSGAADSRQQVIGTLGDALTRCIAGSKEKIMAELQSLRGKYDKATEQTDALAELAEKVEAME